ncbi:MAG: RHS repeat-associated core domain-containing protein [bacterium]|nr:RHS repeat-associated core domain-containing protein [bacterium]
MRLGNGKWENTVFNSRLQPIQIGLGNGVNSQNVLKLEYSYGTTQNNGNVQSQTITIPGVTLPFVQNYTYDSLNRLESAEEKPSGWSNCTADPTKCWKQTFKYDRYGNRNFNTAGTNTTTLPANFDPKIYNPTIDTDDNRFEAGQGYSYDAAGNTTRDAESRKFTYDAENKQTKVETVDGSGDPIATIGEYFYDGDGKRVKKVVPGGETTIFVYDAGGKLIGEYSTIVQPSQDAKTQYLTADHLGTPRINTDAVGTVASRSDYMPYGEEITTGRSSGQGYVVDDVRQGFTGYERDGETDLDYAQARYFASGQGRFSSPDPLMASGRTENPQTWNRYVYVGNNPLAITDPTGEDWIRSNEKNADGVYTYHDVYGKELKKYLAGGNYSRIDFGGSDFAIIERGGVAIYKMFSKGGGEVIATPSTPVADAASQLASAIGNSAPQKIATVSMVAGTGVLIGTGVGAAMWATGTAAGGSITLLGLTEAGTGAATTLGAAAAANPDKAAQIVQGVSVQFGRVANQISHTFRHTDSLGLNRQDVQAAVMQNIQNIASKIPPGQHYNGIVQVGGQTLQYTAFKLPNGAINVGRIHAK